MVSADKMIGSRLGSRIRAVRRVGSRLRKRWIVGPEGAINFVGGNMQEAEVRFFRCGQTSPIVSYLFEKRERPVDIGADKIFRPSYGSVDVALGRKMHNGSRFPAIEQAAQQAAVGD